MKTNCRSMKRLLLPDFKTIDTAAVSCVVKHEARSNGRRISKQTRPSCGAQVQLQWKWPHSHLVQTITHSASDKTTDRTQDPPGGRLLEGSCFSNQEPWFDINGEVWCLLSDERQEEKYLTSNLHLPQADTNIIEINKTVTFRAKFT